MTECFSRRELLPVWRRLVNEAVQIARSEGISLHSFDGFDPNAFVAGAPDSDAWSSMQGVVAVLKKSSKIYSNAWLDIAVHRRKTGADVWLGQMVAVGEAHGIDAQNLKKLVTMISELEAGIRPQRNENLLEFLVGP